MAQILTKIEGILKDKYQPALSNMISIEPSPFLEMIKKAPLTNNTVKCTAPVGINGGFGFGAEGFGTPKAGEQKFVNFEVDAVDMYVDIQISNKTVQLANSNVSAMVNALDAEIQGSYASAKWNVGRALFGDGSGKLTTISALNTAGNTVTVKSLANLVEGLTIDFYATGAAVGSTPAVAGRRITAIDRQSKTITFDGEPTTLAAGFITVQNSYGRELTGLGAIFDSNVTSLYGVSKADNKWIVPLTISAEYDTSDDMLYDGIRDAELYRGSNIDLLIMSNRSFRAYRKYMKANSGITVVDKKKFAGGSTGFSVLVGTKEVIIVTDYRVPDGEVWGVDTSTFTLMQTPWEFMARDSGIFVPMANTSIYRALLASYGNLICSRPGGCVKFTNFYTDEG